MRVLNTYYENFNRLGNRHYVHGTSITTGLVKALVNWGLEPIDRIRVNIHTLSNENGIYDLIDPDSQTISQGKEYNAVFDAICGRHSYRVGLKGNGVPVITSETYDEGHLIEGCQIAGKSESIEFELCPDDPFINILVSLNKKLVNSIFPPEGYDHWFLTRYDLGWDMIGIKKPALLKIKIAGKIGLGHTYSTIQLNEEPMGSIYFSRKKR